MVHTSWSLDKGFIRFHRFLRCKHCIITNQHECVVLLSAYADLLPHYHSVLAKTENLNDDRPSYSSCTHCPPTVYCELPIVQDLLHIHTTHYPTTYHTWSMKHYLEYLPTTLSNFNLTTPNHIWRWDSISDSWTTNRTYTYDDLTNYQNNHSITQQDYNLVKDLLAKKADINAEIYACTQMNPHLKQFFI